MALALRLALAAGNTGITMDSPTYVAMSERLRAGGYQHHGYPLLVAIASAALPGRELPGRAVSVLCGVLLVALIYGLARRRLPPAASALAALLVALHPLIAVYSGAIMSESAFALFLLAGLFAVTAGRALLAGLVLGFAFVIRPEAALVAPLAALLGLRGGRAWLRFALGASLVLLGYAAFLRAELGVWTVTPKTFLVRAPAETPSAFEYRAEDAAPATPRPGTAPRLAAAAPALFRHAPRVAARYLSLLVAGWPWPLLILSVIGLIGAPRAWLAPLALLPGLALVPLQQEMRFLIPVFGALALFAAFGAWRLVGWARGARRGAIALAALAVLAGVAMTWRGDAGSQARRFDDGPMDAYRAAGAWLGRNGRAGAVVMDRKAYVPFFAGMSHVQLGDDPYDTIVETARASAVDYLVVEEFVADAFRPQLRPLLDDRAFRERETRLRALYAARTLPGSGVAIFEVVRDSVRAP